MKNIITISRDPLIQFTLEPSRRFKDNIGYTIKCKVDEDDELIINSGCCHENWWIDFKEKLNGLQCGHIQHFGYGGSEGDFSTQFHVTRDTFHFSLNNFGELMRLERTYKINFSLTEDGT